MTFTNKQDKEITCNCTNCYQCGILQWPICDYKLIRWSLFVNVSKTYHLRLNAMQRERIQQLRTQINHMYEQPVLLSITFSFSEGRATEGWLAAQRLASGILFECYTNTTILSDQSTIPGTGKPSATPAMNTRWPYSNYIRMLRALSLSDAETRRCKFLVSRKCFHLENGMKKQLPTTVCVDSR